MSPIDKKTEPTTLQLVPQLRPYLFICCRTARCILAVPLLKKAVFATRNKFITHFLHAYGCTDGLTRQIHLAYKSY